MPYLAASEYGAGGADLVCASGPHGAARFRDLGVPGERIIVTGQPRFDHLRTLHPAPLPGVVTMFTTPFAYADLGIDRQRRQLSLAAELWQAFARVGVDFRIKPHPREDVTDYRAAIPALAVQAGGSIEALQETALAIIGMSTVTEEAGLLRVPVIVPGDVIHAGRGDDPALSRDVYPRFDDAQTAVALAMSLLRDGPLRSDVVERQAVAVAQKVHVDPDAPAAALIADAICSLMP